MSDNERATVDDASRLLDIYARRAWDTDPELSQDLETLSRRLEILADFDRKQR